MKKFIKVVLSALVVVGVFAGCGGDLTSTEKTSENVILGDLSGSVKMNGSTSMEKLATAMNEAFMEKYPSVVAEAQFTGSGAGIEAVANGIVDIGNSSRNLKEEEKAKGLIENVVAIDGIGVITEKSNTIENLTKQQLIDIYCGKIKNWKDIGGNDSQIVVIGREAGSGTRGAFEEILGIEDKCEYVQEIDSTGAVMAKVSTTPGAVGYVSLDVIDESVKLFKLESVEATAENIKADKYFLSRPFIMATRGDINSQPEAVKEYFKFIDSEEGQKIISMVGLISAK